MTGRLDAVGARLLRLVPALRRSIDQVPAYASLWESANARALELRAPLWVVLGDSTAQAIGVAAGIEHGYVGRVQHLLEQRDGAPWRVVNLSRSGAVLADVLREQLPSLSALPTPALVTCVVGGNDLRRTPLPALLDDVRSVVKALPEGALVASMPRGLRETKAAAANALLRDLATARGLPVADLWSHTGPPWRGKYADGLHPNAAGLTDWVAALAEALALPGELDPPTVAPRRR